MHPGDCPEWDPTTYARSDQILTQAAVRVLVELRLGQLASLELAADTRPIHSRLFINLTPNGYEYFAGHYRGELFRCLRFYEVGIRGDPRVGYPPINVPLQMNLVAQEIETSLRTLDAAMAIPNVQLAPEYKLLYIVVFACRLLELFLRIHPYANGNGHSARFLVWCVLGRYGYWPQRWPIHPRPQDPPYTELITRYRNGETEPLERYMLNNILGP